MRAAYWAALFVFKGCPSCVDFVFYVIIEPYFISS
jgi:hypothetical protein